MYWTGTAENVPDGWLICNGASIITTNYPELFSAIGYRYGGSGTRFYLPCLTDGKYVKMVGTTAATGIGINQGLPNITGATTNNFFGDCSDITQSGALTVYWKWATSDDLITISGGDSKARAYIKFNAANSNSIYGNSNNVTPYTFTSIPMIKAI